MDSMWTLAIVPAIVWVGVFAYMLMLDRRLARLEAAEQEHDDL